MSRWGPYQYCTAYLGNNGHHYRVQLVSPYRTAGPIDPCSVSSLRLSCCGPAKKKGYLIPHLRCRLVLLCPSFFSVELLHASFTLAFARQISCMRVHCGLFCTTYRPASTFSSRFHSIIATLALSRASALLTLYRVLQA